MSYRERLLGPLLLAVFSALVAIPAQAEGEPSPVDARIGEQLDSLGMAYEVDPDNDYALVIHFDDGRSQLVFVRSQVYESRGIAMRDIWSDGYEHRTRFMPTGLETRLLEENVQLVMGGWVREGNRIAHMVKIPDDAPAEMLKAAILEVAETADELEKELLGTDEL